MKAPISDFRSYTPFTDFLAGKDEAYRRAWIEAVKTVRSAMAQDPGYAPGERIGLNIRPGPKPYFAGSKG